MLILLTSKISKTFMMFAIISTGFVSIDVAQARNFSVKKGDRMIVGRATPTCAGKYPSNSQIIKAWGLPRKVGVLILGKNKGGVTKKVRATGGPCKGNMIGTRPVIFKSNMTGRIHLPTKRGFRVIHLDKKK